ncbi:MAG TPA: CbiQ family ECF transporter T component [Rhodocyclaceae bacterium]|jgi:hypothetical protein|nr:CbiQ family ECF transporter T component [Rhodocyclaceae bacterium]
MFHPASLLLLWAAGVVALQFFPLVPTLVATLASALAAWWLGRGLFLRLLKRSRWLFLTMAILFLCLSPGIRLPSPFGELGLTKEGLDFALEHTGRLLTMLALLALLLSHLSHRGVVSGFYLLMAPFRFFDGRRSLAVRLMLTLEAVAGKDGQDWRSLLHESTKGPDSAADSLLTLAAPAWTWRDSLLVGGALLVAVGLVWQGGGS